MLTSDSGETAGEWFAVQVHAGRERVSATHLRASGYEVFLPCGMVRRRWSDRVKTVETALFTGYLFCRNRADVIGKIVRAPGVIRIVSDGRRPLPVPLHEIEILQRAVDAGLRLEPWRFLKAGHRVCLADGPLRGTEGIVVAINKGDRLIVSISLLQRSVAVEIDPNWLGAPDTRLAGDAEYRRTALATAGTDAPGADLPSAIG